MAGRADLRPHAPQECFSDMPARTGFRQDPHDARIEQLRVPPHSIEAEQAVLGGLMLAPEAYDRINDKLTPNDFYRRDHQLIYRAIGELAERNRPFDAVTLGEWFESQGQMELIAGGASAISPISPRMGSTVELNLSENSSKPASEALASSSDTFFASV